MQKIQKEKQTSQHVKCLSSSHVKHNYSYVKSSVFYRETNYPQLCTPTYSQNSHIVNCFT